MFGLIIFAIETRTDEKFNDIYHSGPCTYFV